VVGVLEGDVVFGVGDVVLDHEFTDGVDIEVDTGLS